MVLIERMEIGYRDKSVGLEDSLGHPLAKTLYTWINGPYKTSISPYLSNIKLFYL